MKLCLRKVNLAPRLASVVGLLSAAVVGLGASNALADTAVMPVEARNIEASDADVIGRLFADAYAVESQERVVAPRAAAADEDFGPAYPEEAKRLNADEYVVLSAIGLETRVKLRATRYAADGSVIYSAQMDAASLDDMDVVTGRLARSLWHEVPPGETRTHKTVTREEGRAPNRAFTEKVMGVKSGFFMPYATDVGLAPMLSLGFDGRLEGESYFLEVGAGVLIPSETYDEDESYGGIYSEFGASYYLSSNEISPYVGAGVLPRLILSDKGGAQLSGYGQIGLMFFRSYSTRLYIDARAAQSLTPIVVASDYTYSEDGSYSDQEVRVRPLELGLQVGVGW